MHPTVDAYDELREAYDHFNSALFGGILPPCLITLQREKRTMGYFSARRFVHMGDGSLTDEIAMNPVHFGIVPLTEIMQTLAHEMAHQWQSHFGTPGRMRYHNAEWADKMEAIGLMPSDTGAPGGKRTGDHMADYVIPGGPFDVALGALLETAFAISWADRFPTWDAVRMLPPDQQTPAAMTQPAAGVPAGGLTITMGMQHSPAPALAEAIIWPGQRQTPPTATRAKFTCPSCKANLWGKPALNVLCGDCDVRFKLAS